MTYKTFSEYWDAKKEMLQELGCTRRAAHSAFCAGCDAKEITQTIIERQVLKDYLEWTKNENKGEVVLNNYFIELFLSGR